jgi:stage V sporulation protein R
VGYYNTLSVLHRSENITGVTRIDYYFDVFLQSVKNVKIHEYIKEIERYNHSQKEFKELGEKDFFSRVDKKYPEFNALFQKYKESKPKRHKDLIQFLLDNSNYLNKEENEWMKTVMEVVRKTSIFFQPQIRTKIINEGWASYWHENLFLKDDRIKGHEVDFARINAGVTSMPRVGLNPYALGMRLFYYMEETADKGKYSIEYQRLLDQEKRKKYDRQTQNGRSFIFDVRENYNDFMFINDFVDQDFINLHKLFVSGRRINNKKMVWEYYVKSRNAQDYRKMLFDSLYHPPHIEIEREKSKNGSLHLVHRFEEKPLVSDYIFNTMLGIEYLWGNSVHLETHEVESISKPTDTTGGRPAMTTDEVSPADVKWRKVRYTMEKRKLSKKIL